MGKTRLHAPARRCFHWILEFPEVFLDRDRAGFDAIVGNPPFLGGTKISGPMGTDYRNFIATWLAGRKTDRADLVSFLKGLDCPGTLKPPAP